MTSITVCKTVVRFFRVTFFKSVQKKRKKRFRKQSAIRPSAVQTPEQQKVLFFSLAKPLLVTKLFVRPLSRARHLARSLSRVSSLSRARFPAQLHQIQSGDWRVDPSLSFHDSDALACAMREWGSGPSEIESRHHESSPTPNSPKNVTYEQIV